MAKGALEVVRVLDFADILVKDGEVVVVPKKKSGA